MEERDIYMLKRETKKKATQRRGGRRKKEKERKEKENGGDMLDMSFFFVYLKSCCLEDAVDMFHSVGWRDLLAIRWKS